MTGHAGTDRERTHHQARGPPRALDAFEADVSWGALREAGKACCGRPLAEGSSSSTAPGVCPTFALPVKRRLPARLQKEQQMSTISKQQAGCQLGAKRCRPT